MAQKIDFVSLLHKSQEYISENYAAALSDRSKVWTMKPEYEELVTEALENSFGEVENKSTFSDVLFKIADLAVTDR